MFVDLLYAERLVVVVVVVCFVVLLFLSGVPRREILRVALSGCIVCLR